MKTLSMRKKLLIPGLAILFLAVPAIAQSGPLTNQFNRPTNGIKAGAARPRAVPQRGVQTRQKFTNPSPTLNRNTQGQFQNSQRNNSNGHNTWQGQNSYNNHSNNNNYYNQQGYYPPVYPGPDAPLPPQGTYYVPSPYYNGGYYNNGYYNNGYYNNGYYNQYQGQAPSNNGYVPYRR